MKCEDCGADGAREVYDPVCNAAHNKTNVFKARCEACIKQSVKEAKEIRERHGIYRGGSE